MQTEFLPNPNDFETLVLERPSTVLDQYRQICRTATKKWVLIIDKDAQLGPIPEDYLTDENHFDFISLQWKDAPEIYGRQHFGIGFYRVSALSKFLDDHQKLSSEGLDLILERELKTWYARRGFYYHNCVLSPKRFFRYGRGRAYYMKFERSVSVPRAALKAKYWKLYLSYLGGFVVGLLSRIKDRNW